MHKRKPKKLKQKKAFCDVCEIPFVNAGALGSHNKSKHPPAPPKPMPIVTYDMDAVPNDLDEQHSLIGEGNQSLQVGDTFYRVQKLVVLSTKRKRVDGVLDRSETMVTAKCVKRHWQVNKPL